jgi:isomerase DpgB
MTISSVRHSRATVIDLHLDSASSLAAALARVNAACDQAEDAGPGGLLLLHLDAVHGGAGEYALQDADTQLVTKWERAMQRLESLPLPVLATVDGNAGGLLLDVLLTADHRIATPDTRLTMPRSAGTIWPGMAIHRLANQLGAARVRALVLFGVALDAAAAQALGLVDEVSPEPDANVERFIATLDQQALADLALRRRLLLEASAVTNEAATGVHLAACDRTLRRQLPAAVAA